jgi:uncharacterized protein
LATAKLRTTSHFRYPRRPDVDDTARKREDDWFLKNEEQLIAAARTAREQREKERAAQEQAAESARLKGLHFMKCPKCGHDLKEESISGVNVDRCTFCEGLYLDAGEMETLFLKREEDRKGFLKRLIGL